MIKRLAILICLLGITLGSVSAYASPTNKKITAECTSTAPDVITSSVSVTLCAAAPLPCSAATIACPALSCDSSGVTAPSSTTVSCAAPFKVDAVSWSQSYVDYDGSGNILSAGGAAGAAVLSKGQFGFVNTQTATSGDSVTLKVK